MSQQIIRQPDGRYAVFSTNTDTIIIWDATEEETVEWSANQAAEQARRETRRIIEAVATGDEQRIYGRRALTWEQALEVDRKHGGDASAEPGDKP